VGRAEARTRIVTRWRTDGRALIAGSIGGTKRRAAAAAARLRVGNDVIELYSYIKSVHVTAVIASGLLFTLRGLVLHAGGCWAMAWPLRYLSYSIDTVLLTAALMLATILQQYPFVHSWLTVKVVLLALYVVLGSYALKRGNTRAVRVGCWLAALVVFATIIGVARAHHPLGPLLALAR
jgi:uncharacterized membrane protein SirB2